MYLFLIVHGKFLCQDNHCLIGNLKWRNNYVISLFIWSGNQSLCFWAESLYDILGTNFDFLNNKLTILTWIDTSDLRVANQTFRTSANRTMFCNETFSSCSTITRIHTNSIDTSRIDATFVISNTTRLVFNFNRFATSIGCWIPTCKKV